MAGTKALAKLDTFPLVTADIENLKEVVEANLGDDDFGIFDLQRITWPTGKTPIFTLPGDEGDEAIKTIDCIIIAHGNRRAYWKYSYGTEGSSAAPDCKSQDGRRGEGTIAEQHGGLCRACPMAAFGTAKNDKGESTRGQACQQRKMLFLALPGRSLPVVLSVPPTSLKMVKEYFIDLSSIGKPFYSVRTEIGLRVKENAGGIAYSIAVLRKTENLDESTSASMRELSGAYGAIFKQVEMTAEEEPSQ